MAYPPALGNGRNSVFTQGTPPFFNPQIHNFRLYLHKTPELVEAPRIDALFQDGPFDGPDAAALVYWGLARLNRRRGELLEAFYLEDKKTATIALEFGISERAVEGRLRRARQALRMQLERMIKQNGDMQ